MNDLKFATSPFPAGGFAGCYVTLIGTREEISGHILVSKPCKSLVEMDAEIIRLKRNLDRVRVEARQHFNTSK
ncbi:MAG: hypothetical protein WBL55_18525 [Xanthobacteraceae bacterium]